MTFTALQLIVLTLVVILTTSLTLRILTPIARSVHLVDMPNRRKLHAGEIPLIGGVSVFVGCIAGTILLFCYFGQLTPEEIRFWFAASVFVIMGVYDDSRDLSVRLRVLLQASVIAALVWFGGLHITDLGLLLGAEFGRVELGIFAFLFSVIAIVGIVNAFNMVDGIDGLLGGLALVALTSIVVLAWQDGAYVLLSVAGVLLLALIPFLFCNLMPNLTRCPKVFMGDAGSLFIGLTVAWLLIMGTQPDALLNAVENGTAQAQNQTVFRPVTALWLVAVPLMDTITVIIRRLSGGRNPFKADREHLHHFFIRLGLQQHQALLLIVSAASLFAVVGVWSELRAIQEWIMFVSFLVLFCVYYLTLAIAWRRL